MSEPVEKIIVFEAYDKVIMANLVKTKLDAYGIPCFLTGETFSGIYPMLSNQIFPGTRLHIFERDLDQVKELLEQPISNEFFPCPKCKSTETRLVEVPDGLGRAIAKSFFLLLSFLTFSHFALFTVPKKVNQCATCGEVF